MPRNVRNFWIETEVDARQSKGGTGPVSRDGTFCTTILIRDNGAIGDRRLRIYGVVGADGSLEVRADSDEPEHKAKFKAIVLLRGRR